MSQLNADSSSISERAYDSHDSTSSLFTDGARQVHSVLPEAFKARRPHCIRFCDDYFWGPKGTCHMQIRPLVMVACSHFGFSQKFDLYSKSRSCHIGDPTLR